MVSLGALAGAAIVFLLFLFIGLIVESETAIDAIAQSWGLGVLLIAVFLIISFLAEASSKINSTKEISLVSMLGTVSAVLRVPFAALPSVQPSSYIIICSGYSLGPFRGFMVGALTALVSNMFLGHGPWTIFQMLSWGLMGASSAYLRKLRLSGRRLRVSLIAFGFVWGYLFGLIMNVWSWTAFYGAANINDLVGLQAISFWMDSLHAITNAVFLGFFGLRTISIMERYRKRFEVKNPGS